MCKKKINKLKKKLKKNSRENLERKIESGENAEFLHNFQNPS